jgi:8-oxo-dGTP pyrophosphatase MutT (NUDIX family)
MLADFHSLFKQIPAAGGLVLNDKKEILAIYRRKSWDLPKGKIDAGETIEEAAIREVQEETGLHRLRIIRALPASFHTYRLPTGKRILKKTSWYLMETSDEKLTPQTEEDIEKAVWNKPRDIIAGNYPMYKTIREVVQDYLNGPS